MTIEPTLSFARRLDEDDELAEFKAFVWELVEAMLEALTEYPEARQKAAAAVDRCCERRKPIARRSP